MLDMMILGVVAWAFWLFVGIGCFVVWAVDKENGWGAFFGLVVAGLVAHFAHVIDFSTVFSSWNSVLMYIGAYIAIGVGWSFLKWGFYTSNWANEHIEQIKQARKSFLEKHNILSDTVPNNLEDLWMQERQALMKSKDYYGRAVEISEDINVLKNVERILIWCLYWPFSMLWTLIDDPIRAICKFIIFKVFGGVMQFFAHRAKSKVENELFR